MIFKPLFYKNYLKLKYFSYTSAIIFSINFIFLYLILIK